MPKSLKHFRDYNKALKYRNSQRRTNYERGDFGDGTRRRYQDWELKMLFIKELTDRQISYRISRSVCSVQIKRWRILK